MTNDPEKELENKIPSFCTRQDVDTSAELEESLPIVEDPPELKEADIDLTDEEVKKADTDLEEATMDIEEPKDILKSEENLLEMSCQLFFDSKVMPETKNEKYLERGIDAIFLSAVRAYLNQTKFKELIEKINNEKVLELEVFEEEEEKKKNGKEFKEYMSLWEEKPCINGEDAIAFSKRLFDKVPKIANTAIGRGELMFCVLDPRISKCPVGDLCLNKDNKKKRIEVKATDGVIGTKSTIGFQKEIDTLAHKFKDNLFSNIPEGVSNSNVEAQIDKKEFERMIDEGRFKPEQKGFTETLNILFKNVKDEWLQKRVLCEGNKFLRDWVNKTGSKFPPSFELSNESFLEYTESRTLKFYDEHLYDIVFMGMLYYLTQKENPDDCFIFVGEGDKIIVISNKFEEIKNIVELGKIIKEPSFSRKIGFKISKIY